MKLLKLIWEDSRTALERASAACGIAELILCYPGVSVLVWHRLVHVLWECGFKLGTRMVADAARTHTGIEIHSAALMGRRVFIDHGIGVVIVETAEVDDGCILFHGVHYWRLVSLDRKASPKRGSPCADWIRRDHLRSHIGR